MSLFTETIEIRYPGEETDEVDDLGEPIVTAPTVEEQACWYEPRSSSRDVEAKDQTVDGYWLYLPLDAPWSSQCEARIRGDWYYAAGEHGYQPGGFIVDGYIEIPLTLTRG